MEATHCLVAGQFAVRLGLSAQVRDALQHIFERWDGRGTPAGLRGAEIALPARIVVLADMVESFRRLGGDEAAVDVARRRAGGQFDPALAGHVCEHADALLAGLDEATGWDAAIAAEPALATRLSGAALDSALAAIADFADLKSPYTTGHSRGVAERAASAALYAGLGESGAAELRRAGLLHDVGRLGVANTIWDKAGPLSDGEMERVRMHPYLTQRTFSRAPRLARLAEVAATHHERLDGSGYPRGLAGGKNPRRRRRLSGDDRAAPPSRRAVGGGRRRAAAARGRERPTRPGCRRRGAGRCRSPRPAPPRGSGGPDASRGRGPGPARARPLQQADRRSARGVAQDGGPPRRARLPQDRLLDTSRGQPVRDAERAPARARGITRRWVKRPMIGPPRRRSVAGHDDHR